ALRAARPRRGRAPAVWFVPRLCNPDRGACSRDRDARRRGPRARRAVRCEGHRRGACRRRTRGHCERRRGCSRNAPVRAPDDTAARLESPAFVTALERARTVVETWEEELRRELPENAYLFDVHTHLGNDIDGMVGSYDELSSVLDRFGFEGAFMFCLDEHDREPAFTVPND